MIKRYALLKINFSHILAQRGYNNNIDTTSAVDRNETCYGLGRIIEPQRSWVEKIREFNPRRGDTTAAVPLPKSYPYTIMELQTTRRRPDLNQIKGLILKDFRERTGSAPARANQPFHLCIGGEIRIFSFSLARSRRTRFSTMSAATPPRRRHPNKVAERGRL